MFAHVGRALYWKLLDRRPSTAAIALGGLMSFGAIAGLLIVSSLAGRLYAVDVPARYKATYTGGRLL